MGKLTNTSPQYCLKNGKPNALGKLYFYESGTAVLLDTYSDAARTIPNTNPIILDANGFSTTEIYLSSSLYRLKQTDADDVVTAPIEDDITEIIGIGNINIVSPFSATSFSVPSGASGYSWGNGSLGNASGFDGWVLRPDDTAASGAQGLIVDRNDDEIVRFGESNQRAIFYGEIWSTTIRPSTDNLYTLGEASARYTVVYATTGTINTSDARDKTEVQPLSSDEIQASILLGKEIGVYKWLDSIAEKGDKARKHIGMTVQRAIEIMESCNLDPFEYGFICYDEWEDEFEHHRAIEAREATKDLPAIKAQEAWDEQVKFAGNRYGLRYDELMAFLAAGFNARLESLEDNSKKVRP